jgi:hypothetical protein
MLFFALEDLPFRCLPIQHTSCKGPQTVRLQRHGTVCGGFVVICAAAFNSKAGGSANWPGAPGLASETRDLMPPRSFAY